MEAPVKTITFVCLTSRLCNLRCSYCDELPLVSDKRRMSLEQIELIFRRVADHYPVEEPLTLNCQWYGGEPLLIPAAFYREALALQRSILAGRTVLNTMQTNLTVELNDEIVDVLRAMDRVGASIDLVGGLRVDAGGRDREYKAIANVDRLLELGLGDKLGGITVLHGRNRHWMKQIFDFYRKREMHYRLLPLEKGLYGSSEGFGITAREVLAALCEVADLWLQDPAIPIEPLARYFKRIAIAAMNPDLRCTVYDKSNLDPVLMIDVDGLVYGYAGRFKPERSVGNIFEKSLAEILGSEEHHKAAVHAHRRMDRTCLTCLYLGRSCDGYPMAEGENGFGEYDEDGFERCVVARGLIRHLEIRLGQAGLLKDGAARREPMMEVSP
jgi:uncharacterized protein